MNQDCLYVVQVFLGQMQAPIRTAATRGLLTMMGWCRVDNEIWYVAYDGIYSWSGGASTKRSEPIDPLFHGMYVGPYAPIDLTAFNATIDPLVPQCLPKDNIQMYYSRSNGYTWFIEISTGSSGAYDTTHSTTAGPSKSSVMLCRDLLIRPRPLSKKKNWVCLRLYHWVCR